MNLQPTMIRLTKSSAGFYHAGNGRDVLSDAWLSANVYRHDGGTWTVRYFRESRTVYTDTDVPTLRDARAILTAVFAEDIRSDFEVRRAHVAAATNWYASENDRLRAEYDATTQEGTER